MQKKQNSFARKPSGRRLFNPEAFRRAIFSAKKKGIKP
jgi:hypothetical protein